MKSNSEIRVENLRFLIEEKGSRTKFIDNPLARDLKIEYGYVGQLVNGSRGIGNAVARKLEKIGGKPENWIDQVHTGIDITGTAIHSRNASSILRKNKKHFAIAIYNHFAIITSTKQKKGERNDLSRSKKIYRII
jgi:plasmid maintenance system antidote protein VapI